MKSINPYTTESVCEYSETLDVSGLSNSDIPTWLSGTRVVDLSHNGEYGSPSSFSRSPWRLQQQTAIQAYSANSVVCIAPDRRILPLRDQTIIRVSSNPLLDDQYHSNVDTKIDSSFYQD